MTDFATAHAGIAVCRRLVDDMPDAPIMAEDVEHWFATPALNLSRPYVEVDANPRCIAVRTNPLNLGLTEWVDYPQQTVEAVESEEYYLALRETVERKLAEIAAVTR